MSLFTIFLILTPGAALPAHDSGEIDFPSLDGYKTLVCDLHQHTVFSDGMVWPSIRVEEAVRDNVDVIAITEHLEYQPHRQDIPHPNRNRSYSIASKASQELDVVVVPGAEITRDMPPGHMNAIFIQDANLLLQDDPIAVVQEAARQGAFIFWNHPSWTPQVPDGMAKLTDMHRQLISDGLLHGIEVVNENRFSAESLQIALDHDLAILGTSDIHGLIDWTYRDSVYDHRPTTLVFSADKSPAGIKQALMKNRTVALYRNTLIGRSEWIDPLIKKSLIAVHDGYHRDSSVLKIRIRNQTSVPFHLRNISAYPLHDHTARITIEPHDVEEIMVRTLERREHVDMRFEVENALIAPGVHPNVQFEFTVELPPEPELQTQD